MDRETQSRLIEFLLTYGWAVLVVFVAFGVLIFFGLFPSGSLKGSSCDAGPNIRCSELSITGDGNITLTLKNEFGKDLNDVIVQVGNCSKTFPVWQDDTILDGNSTTLTGCSVGLGFFKDEIKVTYKSDECIAAGEISGVIG
ncbi:hypothetical protein ACFLZ6_00590 [Nanoarchaeota archaeon]